MVVRKLIIVRVAASPQRDCFSTISAYPYLISTSENECNNLSDCYEPDRNDEHEEEVRDDGLGAEVRNDLGADFTMNRCTEWTVNQEQRAIGEKTPQTSQTSLTP